MDIYCTWISDVYMVWHVWCGEVCGYIVHTCMGGVCLAWCVEMCMCCGEACVAEKCVLWWVWCVDNYYICIGVV